jgi:hypothetical protein
MSLWTSQFNALLRKNVLVLLSKPGFIVFALLTAFAMPLITTLALESLDRSADTTLQANELKSSFSMDLPSDYAIFYAPDTLEIKTIMETLALNYPSSNIKGFSDETLMIQEFLNEYDSLKLDDVEFAGVFFDGDSATANTSSTSYQIWRQDSVE